MEPRSESWRLERSARLGAPPVGRTRHPPTARVRNFDEVHLPWTSEMVRLEAARCLHCADEPCVEACPLHNNIPSFLALAESGDYEGAMELLHNTCNFPEICARVCRHEVQCESACPHMELGRPAVAVGRIESFVADHYRRERGWAASRPPCSGHRVAVVGAGPAGLTVAELLAEKGHCITVFDQWPDGGGALRYGIPRFRLDHGLVRNRLSYLRSLGVEFVFDTRIGEERELGDLFSSGFQAVFLGTGAGVPIAPAIEGADLPGVHEARSFLVRANVEQDLRPSQMEDPPHVGPSVAVIGGGDVAVDCCRTAIRLGARNVTCYCGKEEAEAGGNPRDRALAQEEGAVFRWGMEISRILEQEGRGGKVLESPGESIMADTVVVVGRCRPDGLLVERSPDLRSDPYGYLVVDPATGRTTMDGVWAGGEAVLGPSPVALSVAQSRRAASDIHEAMSSSAPSDRLWLREKQPN